MRNRVNTYLAIALTTHCNYKCFYCKEGGESMSKQKQTIPFEKVKKKNCLHYKNGNCREGVFSLFLSSNLMLHLSGCKNKTIHFDLNKCEEVQIREAFLKLLSLT